MIAMVCQPFVAVLFAVVLNATAAALPKRRRRLGSSVRTVPLLWPAPQFPRTTSNPNTQPVPSRHNNSCFAPRWVAVEFSRSMDVAALGLVARVLLPSKSAAGRAMIFRKQSGLRWISPVFGAQLNKSCESGCSAQSSCGNWRWDQLQSRTNRSSANQVEEEEEEPLMRAWT